MEGWEDLARDGSVLATPTRASPQTQVLGVRTISCVLEVCLPGSGALGSSPTMPTHPARPCWGGKCVFSRFSAFLLSSTVSHRAKQDPNVRSPFPVRERYRGSQGACGCRERKQDSAIFPAPSPPLRPATPPSFPARVTRPGTFGKFLVKPRAAGMTGLGLSLCSLLETEPGGKRVDSPGCN